MRTIFMGTPEFAVPTLRALHRGTDLVLVVSNPDRPSGRGRKLKPTEVKRAAQDLGLPLFQPTSLRRPEVQERLAVLEPDAIVVAAYGKILPPAVLGIPKLGCINVHASLLPAYRGAAPINWAIMNGERETGVTIMLMDEGLDTGPILRKSAIPILDEDTAQTLSDKLADLGANLLVETLQDLAAGAAKPVPQPSEGVSHAPMLSKADGLVDFHRPARRVFDHIRGTDPWPGAFTFLGDRRLKLFDPRLTKGSGRPGEVLGLENDALVVACARDAVALGQLQLPGKKRMTAGDLLKGRPIDPGTVLGPSSPAGEGNQGPDR